MYTGKWLKKDIQKMNNNEIFYGQLELGNYPFVLKLIILKLLLNK